MYGTAVCTSQKNICRHRTKSADVIRQKFTLSSGQHCPISSTRLKKGARQMKLFISFHDQLRTATLDTKLEATWGNMRQLWESIANCFGLFIKNSLAVNLVKSCKITMVSHFSVFCLWWLKTCQTLLSDEALGSRDCTKCLQQASLNLGHGVALRLLWHVHHPHANLGTRERMSIFLSNFLTHLAYIGFD